MHPSLPLSSADAADLLMDDLFARLKEVSASGVLPYDQDQAVSWVWQSLGLGGLGTTDKGAQGATARQGDDCRAECNTRCCIWELPH